MLRRFSLSKFTFTSLMATVSVLALDTDRDFSGNWVLDRVASTSRALPAQEQLSIMTDDRAMRCSAPSAGGGVLQWSFSLDGREARSRVGGETWSSVAKWEGAALLTNTLVSGSKDFTVMDRWKLSRDRSTLTITRQVVDRSGTTEDTLVYRREGLSVRETPASTPVPVTAAPAPSPAPFTPGSRPVLPKPAEPADAAAEIVVPAGTHIALTLRNAVDTKHSQEGDRVYLETAVPVAVNNRIVIPRGSFVNGTITVSKPAHGVKGKGELFLRFDSITLPNGVTRDFRSRLASASGARGQVDSKEGKITGEREGSGDARTVALGTGIGASVGSVAGAAAGHGLEGAGIGAAAGAAAGLAAIFHGKRPEAVLPQGAVIDMVLDRDLRFSPTEVP